ncbi:hypothetical protein Pcinc_031161 [Petrolisthes cinctipes]|uniref:Gag-like protein n=1 Tax=Petrolisthes cinctipes TaxID=88211 RepID=A0AAE1EX69_PETCI|nr:hypothetical protein Pcinc_031161 [Petrolisthes cinctipes]
MASNQVNLMEGEQAVGLSDALMDRAAEEGTENNSEGTFQVYQSRKKKRKDRESLEGNGDNSIALINKRPRDAAPDAESTAEEDTQPVDKTKATGERKRLYFPNSCGLTLSQKRLWSAKLAQQYRSFKPTLKEGLNRPFITVEGTEAVATLTTEGYDGVVMEQPKDTGNLTKVFIAPYDCLLDPELLQDDDRVVWAKRHVVRGEKKKSVVALVRGEVPEKLHVLGNGYRRVHKYIEQPIQCYNCSQWNHKAWSCRYEVCCRFCGKNHHSSECGKKIKEGETVEVRCCNCGKPHNAASKLCEKRPKMSSKPDNKVKFVDAPVPIRNAWDGTDEIGMAGDQVTSHVAPKGFSAPGNGPSVAISSTSPPIIPSTTVSHTASPAMLPPTAPPLPHHDSTPDNGILQDIMREMRANFAKLYEKVDTLEKKYEAKMDTLEKKCEEKINEMEKKYEALKEEVSAAKGNNKKKDEEEEITPLELKQNCQAIENVLMNLAISAQKEKITKSSLREAVVTALSNSNQVQYNG